MVYYRRSATPDNQFFFWPSYDSRKGENAIYVAEADRSNPQPRAIPPELLEQFESVSDLGLRTIMYHDSIPLRAVQLFACRGLK